MSVVIRQSELRNDNAAVMRRVAEGESFVVTVNGRPVADVVPHRREYGPASVRSGRRGGRGVRRGAGARPGGMANRPGRSPMRFSARTSPIDPFERRRH